MATRRSRLPAELTSFVGRELEITTLRGLLPKSRLVTLTGVGGSGKTRLALQVASELELGYRDGAVFVELATLADGHYIAEADLSAGASKSVTSYAPANWERLGALKRQHDPEDLFYTYLGL
jgi:Ni2+-binding GTPase involved in maturation of urease and hydrogenase